MGGKVRNMTVWKVLLFTVLLLYCFGADTADGDAGDHKGEEGGNLLAEVSLLRSGPGLWCDNLAR